MEVLSHRVLPRRREDSSGVRILQVTDVHLFPPGTREWFVEKKDRMINFNHDGYSATGAIDLVASLVESTSPDLVFFTGDVVDGRPFGENKAGRKPRTMKLRECIFIGVFAIQGCLQGSLHITD